MPFDPKKMMPEMPDDQEEAGEQDAVSAAFDAIRSSIDQAEQSLMMSKFQKPEEEPDDAATPGSEA